MYTNIAAKYHNRNRSLQYYLAIGNINGIKYTYMYVYRAIQDLLLKIPLSRFFVYIKDGQTPIFSPQFEFLNLKVNVYNRPADTIKKFQDQ